MKAMVLLIFAYGGFESALAPMSEAKNPRRDAGFALFVALLACTTIYALVQWVVVGVLGPGATTDRPLAEVARVTMGNRGAGLVAIGALISVYGYLSAKLLGMPRVTFALAKGGDLPKIFAAVGPKFHHTLVFNTVLCRSRVGTGARGKFCLECDSLGRRPPLLLRSRLRRTDSFAPKTAGGCL